MDGQQSGQNGKSEVHSAATNINTGSADDGRPVEGQDKSPEMYTIDDILNDKQESGAENPATETPEVVAEQELPAPKKKSAIGRIFSILGNVLFVLVLLVLAFLVFVMVNGRGTGTASIAGHSIYTVISGSMEPNIHVGSIVVTGYKEIAEIKSGEVITFLNEMGTVTHRVVEVRTGEAGTTFVTKGDANPDEDMESVRAGAVRGVVLFSIPLLGFLIHAIQSGPGVLIIIIPALLIVVVELIRLIRLSKSSKKKP